MAKVLYVTASDTSGADDDGLLELVQSLDRGRYRAHVLLPDAGPRAGAFARLGVDVHVVPKPPMHALGRRWRAAWRFVCCLALLRSQRPAVVHLDAGAAPSATFAAWLHCRLGTARLVWHVRSPLAAPGRLARLLTRLVRRRADAVIATSSPIARQLGSRDGVYVIPRSLDLRRLAPPSPGNQRPGHSPTVGWTGALAPGCGLDQALAVFAMLSAARPGARLVVGAREVARHPEYELAVQARCRPFGDAIEWLPAELPTAHALARMDLLLHLPGDNANDHLLAHALAAGVPVIAWARDEAVDAVQDGATGYVVAAGDVLAAADAAGALLADPSRRRRMGVAAAEFAQATYDRRRCAQAVERTYATSPG